MQITYHAAKRFLERVIKMGAFTKADVHKTKEYLKRVFKDVVVNTYSEHIPLPGFENQFIAICKENNILTIIPKSGV